jgi:phosphosulfolactate phosphohydrolase-like enzyme
VAVRFVPRWEVADVTGAVDLDGRDLVQRTSAGTRGVIAARSATRLWCASLVCASATAAAVRDSGGHRLRDPRRRV